MTTEGEIWEAARQGDWNGAAKARNRFDQTSADERGYPYAPAFSPGGTYCPAPLELVGDSNTLDWVRRVLIFVESAGLGITEAAPWVGSVVLFDFGLWSEFPMWQARFRQLTYAPEMWAEELLQDCPPLTDADAMLIQELRPLTPEARMLGLRPGVLAQPPRYLGVAGLKRGLAELSARGLTRSPPSIEARLRLLTVRDLQSICRQLGQTVSGRRDELVDRLLTSGAHLTTMLPGADQIEVCTSAQRSPAWGWAQSFHELLTHTLVMRNATERSRRSYGRAELFPADDVCPICREAARAARGRAVSQWPPLHPGCRCGVVPKLS